MRLILNKMFSQLGLTIGSRPKTCIVASLLLFALSLIGPIVNLDIRMNLESGYTREDAPSVEEISAHVNFFGNRGKPWYMALFAVARNGSSILNGAQSDELTTFYKYITQRMKIEYENETVYYKPSLCEPFCEFNAQLWNILQYQSFMKLTYPLTTVGPYKMNIGKLFFDRKVNKRGVITGVGTAAIYFTTFVSDTKKENQLELFERGVLDQVKIHNQNKNNSVKFVLHGANTVTQEVQRGVGMTLPYYIAGAGLLTVFVLLSFAFGALSFQQFNVSVLLMGAASLISPLLASISAIGLILLIGFHTNVLVLISPFLTFAIGIGVDDAFLLMNTWMRQRNTAMHQSFTPAERLQLVFEKVGSSIAVTSLTNVLGFAFGCIAPIPEVRIFCASVALSMFMDMLYQFAFYAPLLVVCAERQSVAYEQVKVPKKPDVDCTIKIRKFFATLIKYYSKFIASLWAELIFVGVMIAYLYISICGIKSLHTDMDGSMLLPSDSQSNEGIRIMNEVIWPDYLGINYVIRNPPNFSDPLEYRKFARMINRIETMNNTIGAGANMIWIRDYLRYLANPSASKLDILFGWMGPDGNRDEPNEKGLDMTEFPMFINTEPYDAWQDGVRYKRDEQNRTIITSMLFIVGYKDIHSLADKAKLMPQCRAIAAQYPEYDMVPFDTDSQLIDVILSVPSTTFYTMAYTVVAIGIVFFIFSTNFMTSLVATLSVLSICTGVLGMMHYWGCCLDPLTMVAVIMTAGLGVDFSVHIVFHYLLNEQKHDDCAKRIAAAFNGCALSTVQAGCSTFLVMFPVLFAPVGVYTVIAKAIVLVVIIGLIHGLLLVPILLTALPNTFTGNAWCAKRPQRDQSLVIKSSLIKQPSLI